MFKLRAQVTLPSQLSRSVGLSALRKPLACALVACLLAGTQPGSAQLPTLGDGSDMSLATERKLGDRIAREIYHDPDYVDDPLLFEYVQSIWSPLQAAARARGEMSPEMQERYAWGLMLIRDRTINAFALPGGYMGVHLGLIGLVDSRDELASVLGHELSHITQRHISRLTTKQGQQTPLILAAMILGVLAASKSPNAAGAVFTGGQALAVQSQLNFSRDMEREADRIGYNVVEQAGFDPRAFVTMFEKLDQSSRLNDNGAYPYLRSHPLTTQRIADMQLRLSGDTAINFSARQAHADTLSPGAAVKGLNGLNGLSPSDPYGSEFTHGMMAARARILAEPGVDGLRSTITDAEAFRPTVLKTAAARQAAVVYGAVLANMKLHDLPQSKRWMVELQRLTKNDAEANRIARLLHAELALQANDWRLAYSQIAGNDKTAGGAIDKGRAELLLEAQIAVLAHKQNAGQNAGLNTGRNTGPTAALSTAQSTVKGACVDGNAVNPDLSLKVSSNAAEGADKLLLPPLPKSQILPSQILRQSLQHLQAWVYAHPHDAGAWQALSSVAAAENQRLRAVRAEAEVQVANMDLPAAIDRLKAAQEIAHETGRHMQAADAIEASIIDTRLHEVEAQLRSAAKDKSL